MVYYNLPIKVSESILIIWLSTCYRIDSRIIVKALDIVYLIEEN